MKIQELRLKKEEIGKEVDILVVLKKKLYSNMDIESPMSTEEKELNKKVSKMYSEINSIVREIQKLK